MNTSILTNNRRSSLLATFAIGAVALISARAQADDPARSIADVAQEHGLNANMISRWRRAHERGHYLTFLIMSGDTV